MTTEIEKTEQANDDLDLAQLMDQIRLAANQRRREALKNGTAPFYRQLATEGLESLLANSTYLPDFKLQPPLEKRDQYQINYLLGFHDEAFVRNAYHAILRREPDDAGFAEYLKQLRSGRYSKIDILRSLRFSPEGQKADVPIEGLGSLGAFRKLYRVPVVGYLLRLAVGVARLPVLITNHRRLEAHTTAQLERVATHLNEAVASFSAANQRQADVSRKQIAAINELKNTLSLQIDALISENERTIKDQDVLKADLLSSLEQSDKRSNDQFQQHGAELRALKVSFEKHFEDLIERLRSSQMDLAQQETRLAHLLEEILEAGPLPAAQIQILKNEEDHLLDSLYFSLEDTLRGTPAEIKEEVKVYLPVLKAAGITSDILDVGCGRGEWLEVLREAGIKARGIDANRILVDRCKSLSLDVIEAEALTHLRSQPDRSLNAVSALHFAEHLPLKTLVTFLDEVGRTLKPGGLVILETPNPENLVVGSCNFYLDPTHKNPIPIPTMKLLLEARGFWIQDVLRLHAVGSETIEVKDQLTSHVNHFLYGPMNYAVVARKPDVPHDPS